jgi:hypothetical protein
MPSFDYQVLAFRDSAPLTRIGLYSSDPVSLDIRGKWFVGVAKVLINGVESPEFIVLSEKQILAQVPKSELDARIREVRVLLARSGITQTSAIELEAVVPGARASGFNRLLQQFLKLLFTNPGEDFNDVTLGGGLGSAVGASGTSGDLKALAAQAVSDTETQLIRLQTSNPHLQDSERLRSATLLEAQYVPATTSLNIRLQLTAMDGTTGTPVVSV